MSDEKKKPKPQAGPNWAYGGPPTWGAPYNPYANQYVPPQARDMFYMQVAGTAQDITQMQGGEIATIVELGKVMKTLETDAKALGDLSPLAHEHVRWLKLGAQALHQQPAFAHFPKSIQSVMYIANMLKSEYDAQVTRENLKKYIDDAAADKKKRAYSGGG